MNLHCKLVEPGCPEFVVMALLSARRVMLHQQMEVFVVCILESIKQRFWIHVDQEYGLAGPIPCRFRISEGSRIGVSNDLTFRRVVQANRRVRAQGPERSSWVSTTGG